MHYNTYKCKQQANKIAAMVGSIEEHALSSQMLPNKISYKKVIQGNMRSRMTESIEININIYIRNLAKIYA